jgi:hypothetical protein
VRGTVKEFTTAPKGEVDGLILGDDTVVHWPPHLQSRFTDIVAKGDRVQVTGWLKTGPKGDTKLEVSTLTNLRTSVSRANEDRPPPGAKGKKGKDKGGPILGEFRKTGGTVKEFTTAPKGEVDGFILSDGTWVHWPPHQQGRFTDIVAKGDRVRVVGQMETGKKGDTKLEVSTLTNVGRNVTRSNPDRPAPESVQGSAGKAGDIEDRLKSLEDKLDLLMREIDRLQRKK